MASGSASEESFATIFLICGGDKDYPPTFINTNCVGPYKEKSSSEVTEYVLVDSEQEAAGPAFPCTTPTSTHTIPHPPFLDRALTSALQLSSESVCLGVRADTARSWHNCKVLSMYVCDN